MAQKYVPISYEVFRSKSSHQVLQQGVERGILLSLRGGRLRRTTNLPAPMIFSRQAGQCRTSPRSNRLPTPSGLRPHPFGLAVTMVVVTLVHCFQAQTEKHLSLRGAKPRSNLYKEKAEIASHRSTHSNPALSQFLAILFHLVYSHSDTFAQKTQGTGMHETISSEE